VEGIPARQMQQTGKCVLCCAPDHVCLCMQARALASDRLNVGKQAEVPRSYPLHPNDIKECKACH
jgi:hypothetical protein